MNGKDVTGVPRCCRGLIDIVHGATSILGHVPAMAIDGLVCGGRGCGNRIAFRLERGDYADKLTAYVDDGEGT